MRMSWITENLATILVGIAVLAVVALIITHMRRQKKKNPHGGSCGCDCGSCPYSDGCGEPHAKG